MQTLKVVNGYPIVDSDSRGGPAKMVPTSAAPAEAPAGDATVITEEDMKAISDLLAAAVGVGAPLAASAADTADAGAAVGGDRGAGEPSGDPAPVLAPRVVDPEGGEVPGPEEAAPAEAALSSGIGDSELPSTTSGRASAGADAVAARTGTRPPAGALPRRAVEAVLELASPADLVRRSSAIFWRRSSGGSGGWLAMACSRLLGLVVRAASRRCGGFSLPAAEWSWSGRGAPACKVVVVRAWWMKFLE